MSTAQNSLNELLESFAAKCGAQPESLRQVAGMLQSGDGLAGLVKQFQERGLGDVISSWIGSGPNQPISPREVEDAFGEKLHHMAAETGEAKEQLSAKLSELLPALIDQLTPDGKMPENSWLQQGLDMLRRSAK
ncbi:MAG: YidB family protein [Pirellulales bacterium]|nr:YidB family protein [Pirellulales bacterium]